MTKLIIQIPCYNEEKTLGTTLSALPRTLPGVDIVERLIIDDGSSDRTLEVAQQYGVEHIVRFPKNKGLAKAFQAGLTACLHEGADIIVNTDADNQYCADDIPKLIEPILSRKADIVIGTRPIETIAHFSPLKKLLQRIGSRFVRMVSNTDIPDAPSGFRALSRDATIRFNAFNTYTYTLEMIIRAGRKNMAIIAVPIDVNNPLRPSRLIKSIPHYLWHSLVTIVRIFVIYKPFRFFASIGTALLSLGLLLGGRFLYFYLFTASRSGHVQSLILASILMLMGFQALLSAFLADLSRANRELLEDMQYEQRKARYNKDRS